MTVALASCTFAEPRFQYNYDESELAGLAFVPAGSPLVLKRSAGARKGAYRRAVAEVAAGELLLRNGTTRPCRITLNLPPDAQCRWLTAGQRALPLGHYRDAQGERHDCYALCVDVPPRSRLAVCTARCTPGPLKGYYRTADTEHPEPQPQLARLLTFPVRCDQPCYCPQGWGGQLTHFGEFFHHAVDFMIPEGTELLAAADGVVTKVDDAHCTTGQNVDYLTGGYNEVLLGHDDGTESQYLHIQQGSATVALGQRVQAGTVIARAGSTGFSPWPHLHFQLNRGRAAEQPQHYPSVAFAFQGAEGPFVPVAGHWYTSRGRVEVSRKRGRSPDAGRPL